MLVASSHYGKKNTVDSKWRPRGCSDRVTDEGGDHLAWQGHWDVRILPIVNTHKLHNHVHTESAVLHIVTTISPQLINHTFMY